MVEWKHANDNAFLPTVAEFGNTLTILSPPFFVVVSQLSRILFVRRSLALLDAVLEVSFFWTLSVQ